MEMTGTTEMTRVVVIDCLDTIQGYNGAEHGISKPFYQAVIAREQNLSVAEMVATVPYERQLEWTARMLERGDLEPIALPGSFALFGYLSQAGLEARIVTADIPEAAVYTTKPFVDAGLITYDRVHAIASLGSKKQSVTWKRAQEVHYPGTSVVGVFEDTEENMQAAMTAYVCNGYHAKEAAGGLTVVLSTIVRGNLYALKGALEQHLSR
jgi:hypothetical protein